MPLLEEVDRQRKNIQADGYPMSIGELLSMYRDNEMDIHPEFQRFYRWGIEQKSKFIESLLLGIPIPSIFVHQRKDGVWDVIDGLQRLSTVFEFMGVLSDESGKLCDPLILTGTKLLPALRGVRWAKPAKDDDEEGEEDPEVLPGSLKLVIKRSKLDVKIILRESDDTAKYELFQRLNRGGSVLSDQEVRNCILVMENPEFYQWLRTLSKIEDFKSCIPLTEKALEEQYDLELVVRLIALHDKASDELRNVGDLGDYLTDEIRRLALDSAFDREGAKRLFEITFAKLNSALGEDSFKRYYLEEKRFKGGFLISAFEAIAMGLYSALSQGKAESCNLLEVVVALWADSHFLGSIGSGIRASTRIHVTIPLGRQRFEM